MDSKEIRDLFAKHELPLGRKDIWDVKGKPVILHSALERLSAHLELTWDLPTMIRVTDTEVVVLARATRKDGIAEWSFGEVKIGNGDGGGANYLIKGKQPGYPFAMAEKRAKDRVIIKLAGMHGAYSEEEADDFAARNADREGRQGFDDQEERQESRPQPDARPEPQERVEEQPEPKAKPATRRRTTAKAETKPEPETDKQKPANDDEPDAVKALREQIAKSRTVDAVTQLMLKPETQQLLNSQSNDLRDELRALGKDRLVALGWPGKAA